MLLIHVWTDCGLAYFKVLLPLVPYSSWHLSMLVVVFYDRSERYERTFIAQPAFTMASPFATEFGSIISEYDEPGKPVHSAKQEKTRYGVLNCHQGQPRHSASSSQGMKWYMTLTPWAQLTAAGHKSEALPAFGVGSLARHPGDASSLALEDLRLATAATREPGRRVGALDTTLA